MNDNGTELIQEMKATGAEIDEIIKAIEPGLMGHPKHQVLIASLSLAVLIMNPDISAEKLQEAVKGTSQYICLFLSGLESGEMRKEQLN